MKLESYKKFIADNYAGIGPMKYVVIRLTDDEGVYGCGSFINNDDVPKSVKRHRLKLAFMQLRELISREDFKQKAKIE